MANSYNSNNNYVLDNVNYGCDRGTSIAVADNNVRSHYNPLNQEAFRQYGSYVGKSGYSASRRTGTNQEGNNDEEKYFDTLPSGYRFTPYDSELIEDYLIKKINKEKLPPNRIKDVELYKYNPSDLAEMYPANEGKEWYFFTPRDRKYRNGDRPNRRAGDGFWKATGADKPVKKDGVVTGFRKALVFYIGKPNGGHKTDWIMHEYKVNSNTNRVRTGEHDMRLDDWVLCRIYRKADRSSKAKPPRGREIASTSYAEPPEPEPEVCDAIEYQHVLSEDPHSLANLDFISNLHETQLYPDITIYVNGTFTNPASQLISPASVMLAPPKFSPY
ncbi:hypothetical protein K2173_002555 [Erythroxylum novogranatense]|uniref:NAC domain-containing protein n=1 Tax=Erythroxylum novogranatense TaxID=1862640 RepID=A0AAV8TS96_9ROSI|nr:hypothetical protein K2173_002555 [Erythroxylum novogranatense]